MKMIREMKYAAMAVAILMCLAVPASIVIQEIDSTERPVSELTPTAGNLAGTFLTDNAVTYKLMGDANVTANTTTGYTSVCFVVSGGTVEEPIILDLNGHIMRGTGDKPIIILADGASFRLIDSSPETEHYYTYKELAANTHAAVEWTHIASPTAQQISDSVGLHTLFDAVTPVDGTTVVKVEGGVLMRGYWGSNINIPADTKVGIPAVSAGYGGGAICGHNSNLEVLGGSFLCSNARYGSSIFVHDEEHNHTMIISGANFYNNHATLSSSVMPFCFWHSEVSDSYFVNCYNDSDRTAALDINVDRCDDQTRANSVTGTKFIHNNSADASALTMDARVCVVSDCIFKDNSSRGTLANSLCINQFVTEMTVTGCNFINKDTDSLNGKREFYFLTSAKCTLGNIYLEGGSADYPLTIDLNGGLIEGTGEDRFFKTSLTKTSTWTDYILLKDSAPTTEHYFIYNSSEKWTPIYSPTDAQRMGAVDVTALYDTVVPISGSTVVKVYGGVYFGGVSNANLGGAVFQALNTDFKMTGGNVLCSSGSAGHAAFFMRGNPGEYDFSDVVFAGNRLGTVGSILLWTHAVGEVERCYFIDSVTGRSEVEAGQPDGNGGKFTAVRDCYFQGITLKGQNASNQGFTGALAVENNSGIVTEIDNCHFKNCIYTGATTYSPGGSALYIFGHDTRESNILKGYTIVTNCTFETCSSAKNGGAVYASDSRFVSCSFKDCKAGYLGGALYCWSEHFMSMTDVIDCTFTGNEALSGGAILLDSTSNLHNTLYIEGTTFEYNTSDGAGGAIATSEHGGADSFWVKDSVFTSNQALGYRADGEYPSDVTIKDPKGNVLKAGSGSYTVKVGMGGAIHIGYAGSNARVESCDFSGNSANIAFGGEEGLGAAISRSGATSFGLELCGDMVLDQTQSVYLGNPMISSTYNFTPFQTMFEGIPGHDWTEHIGTGYDVRYFTGYVMKLQLGDSVDEKCLFRCPGGSGTTAADFLKRFNLSDTEGWRLEATSVTQIFAYKNLPSVTGIYTKWSAASDGKATLSMMAPMTLYKDATRAVVTVTDTTLNKTVGTKTMSNLPAGKLISADFASLDSTHTYSLTVDLYNTNVSENAKTKTESGITYTDPDGVTVFTSLPNGTTLMQGGSGNLVAAATNTAGAVTYKWYYGTTTDPTTALGTSATQAIVTTTTGLYYYKVEATSGASVATSPLICVQITNTHNITYYDENGNQITSLTPKVFTEAAAVNLPDAPTKLGSAGYWVIKNTTQRISTIPIGTTADVAVQAAYDPVMISIRYMPSATDVAGTMESQSVQGGAGAILLKNGYSRYGYTFQGWSLFDGGSAVYVDNQALTDVPYNGVTKVATLYAVWKPVICTVQIIEAEESDSYAMYIPYGADFQLPSALAVDNTEFAGWFDGASSDANRIGTAGRYYTVAGNTAIYAHYDRTAFAVDLVYLDEEGETISDVTGIISVAYNSLIQKGSFGLMVFETASAYTYSIESDTPVIQMYRDVYSIPGPEDDVVIKVTITESEDDGPRLFHISDVADNAVTVYGEAAEGKTIKEGDLTLECTFYTVREIDGESIEIFGYDSPMYHNTDTTGLDHTFTISADCQVYWAKAYYTYEGESGEITDNTLGILNI